MSTDIPTQPSIAEQAEILTDYSKFKHYAAITLLIGAPILISIPPRKLDLYTFSLAGAFIASANQITVERTGRGIIGQFGGRYAYGSRIGMQEQEDAVAIKAFGAGGLGDPLAQTAQNRGTSLLEEKVRDAQDWKEERLREEQEKLNEGEGYSDMIMDQIWAVWNQEGKKKGQEKEK